MQPLMMISRTLGLVLVIAPVLVFAGSNTKGQSTLVLSVRKMATDVFSTGRIRTTSTAAQPLDDTVCIVDPEHALVCQGVGKPARVRIPRKDGDALNVSVKGSVCSARPRKTSTPSWKDDVIVTGESITGLEGVMLPDIPAITAWEIHCQDKKEASAFPSTETDDQGYDSPVQVVDITSVSTSLEQQNTSCVCGKIFDTVNQLTAHRRGSRDTRCKLRPRKGSKTRMGLTPGSAATPAARANGANGANKSKRQANPHLPPITTSPDTQASYTFRRHHGQQT